MIFYSGASYSAQPRGKKPVQEVARESHEVSEDEEIAETLIAP